MRWAVIAFATFAAGVLVGALSQLEVRVTLPTVPRAPAAQVTRIVPVLRVPVPVLVPRKCPAPKLPVVYLSH